MKSILAAAAAAMIAAGQASAAELTLNVEAIKEAAGTIQVAVYDTVANFRNAPVRAVKLEAKAGVMQVRIADLPPGDYAVMLFQDLNGNDKVDANLLGMPTEPWGASIGGKTLLGAPGWSDARFTLPPSGSTITIELRH